MIIKTILAVTDLSTRENITVQRACQLARTHRAAVKLMYVPARGQPLQPAAASRLANAARQLEDSLGLPVTTAPVKTVKFEDLVTEAKGMDLVVLAHRHERSTGAFFRGQPVLRLLRCSNCPVLVARQAKGALYQSILVAVELSAESHAVVKLAAEFDSGAELDIFHAIDIRDESKLRSAEAPEHAVRAYREKCLKDAQERIVSLADSFCACRNRLRPVIGRGDAGRQTVIKQERSGADLVVVGMKRSTAWEDFFCGSVVHRVLSWGSSDVLVVPEVYLQATAPIARRRMARRGSKRAWAVPPAGRRVS